MGWIGKIIGGTIGLFIGGPLGAIAGAALGHGFDTLSGKGQGGSPRNFFTGASPGQATGLHQAQLTFFVGTFSMLAKLAKADGNVSRPEMEAVNNFIRNDLRLDPQSSQIALNIFNTALSSTETFESFAAQFYEEFQHQQQMLELLIDVLFRVSAADGRISSAEDALIRKAARIFRFTDSHLSIIRKRYTAADDSMYAVLECSPSDSNDTIKKAYKRLVMEYHPDKVASKGLPEEFIEFAHKKFRKIQEAYESIRKERGF